MSECKISEVSSRVCERGTKCCVVQHGGEMSDTPRTDAVAWKFRRLTVGQVEAAIDFAKELERENAELRNKLEQAEGILREIEAQLGCDKGNAIAAIIRVKHLLISTSTANSHDG